jgi:2,4-dienoyl-CoA reductase (NADPH2)
MNGHSFSLGGGEMDRLFSPAQIGTMELPNRLIMTPMHLGYCPTGEVTPRLIEFYRARAKGGVGLIIVGGCGIDRLGNAPGMVQLDDDVFVPGLSQLVEAVHTEGAKIIPQLYQSGRYASSRAGQTPVAPSPIASKLTGEVPKELNQEDIADIILSYAEAAKRAKLAGFDGVEILASAGYLISQFLSSLTNQREDRYGGDLQGRMSMGLEVVGAVREAVGADFPILVRVAGNDFMPGGNTNKEAQAFCIALEQAGVNAINVTGGWHETSVPQLTMNVPPGAFRYLARGIKQAVSIPVIACNRITTPELAEEILTQGDADFVGLARPLLADPEFVNKARSGDRDNIRPCIGCNQGCLDHVFRAQPVSCTVNPEAGLEAKLLLKSTDTPSSQRLLVIGAGPAGLEFALESAHLGHKVTIWELAKQAGGQLTLASSPPGRQDFLRLRDYLFKACENAGVKLAYETEGTAHNILSELNKGEFDAVVIASGAKPILPALNIEPGAAVVQAWDILAGKRAVGEKILIIGGGAVGVETALHLAENGGFNAETLKFLWSEHGEGEGELRRLLSQGNRDITVIEMAKGIGRDIGLSTRWSMLQDLRRSGIKLSDQTKALSITKQGVVVEKVGEQYTLPADLVILAIGSCSENQLYKELTGKVDNLYVLGDAQKPAKVFEAIHDAYALAKQIKPTLGRD